MLGYQLSVGSKRNEPNSLVKLIYNPALCVRPFSIRHCLEWRYRVKFPMYASLNPLKPRSGSVCRANSVTQLVTALLHEIWWLHYHSLMRTWPLPHTLPPLRSLMRGRARKCSLAQQWQKKWWGGGCWDLHVRQRRSRNVSTSIFTHTVGSGVLLTAAQRSAWVFLCSALWQPSKACLTVSSSAKLLSGGRASWTFPAAKHKRVWAPRPSYTQREQIKETVGDGKTWKNGYTLHALKAHAHGPMKVDQGLQGSCS